MTEQELRRANNLLYAREQINDFLATRGVDSPLVRSLIDSAFGTHQQAGKDLPEAPICEIAIVRADSLYEEARDALATWRLPRDVLEDALIAQLDRIAAELKQLGIVREDNLRKVGEKSPAQ